MTDQTFDLSQEDYDTLIQQILTQEEQCKGEDNESNNKVGDESVSVNFEVVQQNASPNNPNESDYNSEYSSSELEPEDKENLVSSFFSGSTEESSPPPTELLNCTIGAAFGTRRKPEMTFLLSLKNLKSDSIFPWDQSCTIELNSEEITSRYSPNKQKKRKQISYSGYFIHVRVYTYLMAKGDNENYYLAHLKTINPYPLEFVHPRDKFVTIKEGQVKVRIRENITMKHLMAIDNIKQPTQLYIQFSLTYNGELLCETPHCPISFTITKKKKLVETTDIIFSPSKIPQSVASMIAQQQGQQITNEPSCKRLKIEPSISSGSISNPCSPSQSPPIPSSCSSDSKQQNMFPTSTAIWSSNSPVDIINYLESQMMGFNGNNGMVQGVTPKVSQMTGKGNNNQAATQYGNIINPTMMPVVMLVPTSYVTPNGTQAVAMTPVQVQTTPTQIVTINGSHHIVTQQPIKQYCGNGQYGMMGSQQMVTLPGSPVVSPRKGSRYQRSELETVTDSYSNIHMLQLPILTSNGGNNSQKVPDTLSCKQVVNLESKENSPENFIEKVEGTTLCCVDELPQNGNQLDGWIDNLLS